VESYDFKDKPYYTVKSRKKGTTNFNPTTSELENVFFPKSRLTDRVFGIIEPKIYHDIAWFLLDKWELVINHLFHQDINFYCYSFPIPVTEKNEGDIGHLRSGRMIYEFIEMAENDLVADAFRYTYKIETDIKNFYPSIYTHSLAWALHGKQSSREDRHLFNLLGTKLDKLFQNANDGCTNGLAIGPVISDIASEIILAAIDLKCSIELKENKVEFLGVRFKDDYKILCNSKNDADTIIKCLQRQMRCYNLSLNEGKTKIVELPEGLFRPWILEYNPFTLRQEKEISYKKFESTVLTVLKIDRKFPGTGIIDKFLSELITKDYELKLTLGKKQIIKTLSLLFLLKNRRNKSFPQILAIIELIVNKFQGDSKLVESIFEDVEAFSQDKADYLYDNLWIYYFLKSHGRDIPAMKSVENNKLFQSIRTNEQKIFSSVSDIILYKKINTSGKNELLAKHLAVFPRE